ncbi:pyridoxal-phosphate dependent enzyme [Rudanella paleaurantiibacter]|uniref:Pyridoxal-phosphate dependent enzyme n=2 Tax=Rudanella paleaurantiibacter TaxID=2614655 RepID=A0A7J5TZE6_9BACT|nr:pyridoxal-phosphate dependent enzyme [Rudanella paleaurantiibacter]
MPNQTATRPVYLPMLPLQQPSPLQRIDVPLTRSLPVQLYLKRDDLLHPLVSGNKWRKLKYNLLAAKQAGFDTLLTFGGARSNHLYATAAAGQLIGFRTIGVVRGDEPALLQSSTLQFCASAGMHLHLVSRAAFREKESSQFLDGLHKLYGPAYVLPEGGTNEEAIRGAAEIMPELTEQLGTAPDAVCCAVGTGGTVAGLARSAPQSTKVLGFMALKGWHPPLDPACPNLHYLTDYHFGGYAKTHPELLQFMADFEAQTGVLIEQVYTAKMLYGLLDLARQGFFEPGARVVAIHTGGLQGRLPQDRLPVVAPSNAQ